MARMHSSNDRKGSRNNFKKGSDSRTSSRVRSRRSFDEKPRPFTRAKTNRDRGITKTKVKCASCGIECEVPFKPTSDKPVFCDDCFSKKGKNSSKKDLDIINEKLDIILKILKKK